MPPWAVFKMESRMKTISLLREHWALILVCIVIGGVVFVGSENVFSKKTDDLTSCIVNHKFINPRIDCLNATDKIEQIKGVQEKLEKYIDG